jgi:hypothetical protein
MFMLHNRKLIPAFFHNCLMFQVINNLDFGDTNPGKCLFPSVELDITGYARQLFYYAL